MTACDLGAITKPWEIQKKVAKKIEDEFYFQVSSHHNFFLSSNHVFVEEHKHTFPGRLGEDWVERCAKCNDGSTEERGVSVPSGDTFKKKNKTGKSSKIFFRWVMWISSASPCTSTWCTRSTLSTWNMWRQKRPTTLLTMGRYGPVLNQCWKVKLHRKTFNVSRELRYFETK